METLNHTDDEVLDRAKVTNIEIIHIKNELRCWMGFVVRVSNERPVKAILCGGIGRF